MAMALDGEVVWRRRARGESDGRHPGEPFGPDVAGVVDEVGRCSTAFGPLHQPQGVGGVRRTDDEDEVGG